jgi:hypothetical protein
MHTHYVGKVFIITYTNLGTGYHYGGVSPKCMYLKKSNNRMPSRSNSTIRVIHVCVACYLGHTV